MNYISTDADSTIHFPRHISFEEVSRYVELFNSENMPEHMYFDLSMTELIHSSFIGFLLDAKNIAEKNDRVFSLRISGIVEKTFKALGIYNHFSANIMGGI